VLGVVPGEQSLGSADPPRFSDELDHLVEVELAERDCNFNGVTPETEETPVTDVTSGQDQGGAELSAADEQLLRELTERARTGGLKLTGDGGLLGKLTKMVVEGALEGELDDHLGYGKHDPAGRNGSNSRNGYRAKTVLTDTGPVDITVPRDRDSSFEPKIVAKRQRRLTGIDEVVISLSAKGLTHGEIAAHLAEVYGAEVSKQTISTITDRVMEGMAEWQSRPLDPVYAVVFIDAINVKIREGQVANRPIYLALGVTVDGQRDVLGLWAGEHGDGEGAKFWLRVLAEIKNRGTRDVCMLVCDGLKGLPDAVNAVWEKTIVQTCIVHLLRNSFKYASRRDWAEIAKDLKPVYTAASEAEALDRFAEFSGKWEKRYPAIIRLWENAWAEFVPFLQFDREIRTVICTTNAIESINARLRRAVNARGHFPTEQAAMKCLYLAIMSLDPTGKGRKRWTNRWKAALNAFDITFDGRLSAGRN
jgi:transposase-like protein